jgi:hypothetical protein
MTNFAQYISPHPDALRALKTIETETPAEGVLWELKRVTPDVKYWLCTKGNEPRGTVIDGRSTEAPFKAGDVIVENRTADPETGECEMTVYGPDDVRRLQGLEYIGELYRRALALLKKQGKEFTNVRDKEIRDILREITRAQEATRPGPLI